MTAAIVLTTLIGTGLQFYGAMQAGKQAEAAGDANQARANIEARNANEESRARQGRERKDNQRRLARLRNKMSGTGLQGSALTVLAESAERLETRVQDTARSGHMQALQITDRGNLAAWEGRQQGKATRTRGYGTLLTGVGSAGTQAYQLGLVN